MLTSHSRFHTEVSKTRSAAIDIIQAKGATYYGIGAALVRIIRAIVRDEDAILTVSTLVPESMQLGEVSLSLPSILNRRGIERVLSVALDSSERKALETSAEVVKRNIALPVSNNSSLLSAVFVPHPLWHRGDELKSDR